MFIGTLFISAGKSCKPDKPCPEDIICSMVFKSISVEVLNDQGESVQLTKATVSSDQFDSDINSLEESPAGGPYTIVNDSHKKWLSHEKPRKVVFKGWLKDSLVIEQTYQVRHDCCHVVLVEGPETIILE